jgi:hypothetical protein
MAERSGLSKSTIGRIWRNFGLKPHRQDTFKLSKDPQFVDKVVDVVGLYHHPPEKAVVLCVDEKSQVQALDRSQPVLPMMPGMPERRTHDYFRHGVTSLFAAFNIADGTVISQLHRRHPPEQVEFATKALLAQAMLGRALDAGVPAGWVAADEAYGQDFKFRTWCESAASVTWTRSHATSRSRYRSTRALVRVPPCR